MIRRLIKRIRDWFDWSGLLDNPYDWTEEPYEGDWMKQVDAELRSRND